MSAPKPNRNVRTAQFRAQYGRLPERIRALAVAAYAKFRQDPTHPSLRLHELEDMARGRHRRGSKSVSVSMQYRAIYVEDRGDNVWYWIGTHADYDAFTGRK